MFSNIEVEYSGIAVACYTSTLVFLGWATWGYGSLSFLGSAGSISVFHSWAAEPDPAAEVAPPTPEHAGHLDRTLGVDQARTAWGELTPKLRVATKANGPLVAEVSL